MRSILKPEITKKIQTENPWWSPPNEIDEFYRNMSPRPYMELFFPLVKARDPRRAVVLMGPRRIGKTVMIHHSIRRIIHEEKVEPRKVCYLSVDHPIYTGLALEELFELCKQAGGGGNGGYFVFFDEIQYLKDWERHLKALVDSYPNDKFVVSGSAAAALKLKSTESGAGRFTDFILPPLLFYEYLELTHKMEKRKTAFKRSVPHGIAELNVDFMDYLNFGGYPEVLFSEAIRKDPRKHIGGDIVDKVLLKDLPSLYGIADIPELNYLFNTLAYNTANEVSLSKLARETEPGISGSGLAKNTIKKYLEYLEAAFLIKIVHRTDSSARRFKRATNFKVYLTNPTLRAALFSPVGPDDPSMGGLCETAVFSQYFHSGHPLFYARWDKGEVDIIHTSQDLKLVSIDEVKWSDGHFKDPKKELKSLLYFAHKNNIPSANVMTRTAIGEKKVENVALRFLPASVYCAMIGFMALMRKRIDMGISNQGYFTGIGEIINIAHIEMFGLDKTPIPIG